MITRAGVQARADETDIVGRGGALPPLIRKELEATIRRLLAPGMGILAADESFATIERRFERVGVRSTEASRRAYREMLFTAPGIGEGISGVILFDETIRQRSSDGIAFPRLLQDRGAVPGIKVDLGAKPLAFAPGESVTEGLDGLRERLAEYREFGARFTKWRAVLTAGPGLPSAYAIAVNAHALARFAVLSQEAGLVPIVEPEVLADGRRDRVDPRLAVRSHRAVGEDCDAQGFLGLPHGQFGSVDQPFGGGALLGRPYVSESAALAGVEARARVLLERPRGVEVAGRDLPLVQLTGEGVLLRFVGFEDQRTEAVLLAGEGSADSAFEVRVIDANSGELVDWRMVPKG